MNLPFEKKDYVFMGLLILIPAIFTIVTTHNTVVWWDEAQHLLLVKSYISGTPTTGWWDGRTPLYAMFLTVFSLFGYNEAFLRMVLLGIAISTAIVSYLLFSKMLNKNIAFLSSMLFYFSWPFLFWSARFVDDTFTLLLMLISLYFFYTGTKEKSMLKTIVSGVFLGLAYYSRFIAAILGIVYLAYMLFNKDINKKDIKSYYWIPAALLVVLPFMVLAYIQFGSFFHIESTYLATNFMSQGGQFAGPPWYYIVSLPSFFPFPMFIFILLGIAAFASKYKTPSFNLTNLYIIAFFLAFSLLTGIKSDKYFVLLYPFFSLLAVFGCYFIINYIKQVKKFKYVITAIIVIIMIIINASVAIPVIQGKADSYSQLKDVGTWIKDNTDKNSTIMTQSAPQITYYSERKTYGFPDTEDAFNSSASKGNFSYALVSIFEQHPQYAYGLGKYNFTVVDASFTTDQDGQQQPVAVLYKV